MSSDKINNNKDNNAPMTEEEAYKEMLKETEHLFACDVKIQETSDLLDKASAEYKQLRQLLIRIRCNARGLEFIICKMGIKSVHQLLAEYHTKLYGSGKFESTVHCQLWHKLSVTEDYLKTVGGQLATTADGLAVLVPHVVGLAKNHPNAIENFPKFKSG